MTRRVIVGWGQIVLTAPISMTDFRRRDQMVPVGRDRLQPPGGRLTFDEIVAAEKGYLWNFLRRLVDERDHADAVQEVFLRVHQKLSEYDTSKPFRAWLTGIAKNVASEYRRTAWYRRVRLADAPPSKPDTAPLPDQRTADAELVRKALEMLAPPRRDILVRHYVEGHSMPDIAGALRIPADTAYSRLRLAKAQFEAAMQLLLEGPHEPQ